MMSVLAAVLSGVLFYLSQGYSDVWALAWIAPVPVLWLAYGKTSNWQVMAASAIASLGGAGYLWQAPYPPALLPSLIPAVAISVALFCAAVWFARFIWRRTSPLAALFAFPACWTAFEFLMELHSPNGTYGSLAYTAISAPVLIQSASILGMYAVTFLICLFANTLAMALRAKRETAVAIGIGLLICTANVIFGVVRLARPQPHVERVAGIVDETAVANSWRAHSLAADLSVTETYAREIRAAARGGARFVVTPEGGMASIPAVQSAIVAPLVAASRDTGAQVIAGFHSDTPRPISRSRSRPTDGFNATTSAIECQASRTASHPAAPRGGWATAVPWRSARTWTSRAPFVLMPRNASA